MRAVRFDIEIPTCREGVFVPCGFAAPDDVIECVRLAERLGYEAVWATDFLTPTAESGVSATERPSWYEPMITLAYAAAETRRIRLGTGVVVLPYRDPVILAKQAATLDRLSKGRFLLGLGLGAWRAEFRAVAAWRGRAHRGNMAAEFTEVLRRLLDRDAGPVTFDGEYVGIRDVALDPKPIQQPLPFCMVGRNDDALDRIARLGDALMVPYGAAAERKRLACRAGRRTRAHHRRIRRAGGRRASACEQSRGGGSGVSREPLRAVPCAAGGGSRPARRGQLGRHPRVGGREDRRGGGAGHRSLQRAARRRRYTRRSRFEQMRMFMEDVVPRLR